VTNIKFYTMNGTSLPECLGYPLEETKELMEQIIDVLIEYERELILNSKVDTGRFVETNYRKVDALSRVREFLMTSPKVNPIFDPSDPNCQYLFTMITHEMLMQVELSKIFLDKCTKEEQKVILEKMGFIFGHVGHKREIMIYEAMKIRADRESTDM